MRGRMHVLTQVVIFDVRLEYGERGYPERVAPPERFPLRAGRGSERGPT
jgi:hypothetical protein